MNARDRSPARRGAEDAITLRLGGGADSAAIARKHLSRLRADIDPPLMETMRLLVTELIANSVKHTRTEQVGLKVLVGRSSVVVEVTDAGPGFDPDGTPEPSEESGWGLFLVERLANRWGVSRDGTATKVWFELVRG